MSLVSSGRRMLSISTPSTPTWIAMVFSPRDHAQCPAKESHAQEKHAAFVDGGRKLRFDLAAGEFELVPGSLDAVERTATRSA